MNPTRKRTTPALFINTFPGLSTTSRLIQIVEVRKEGVPVYGRMSIGVCVCLCVSGYSKTFQGWRAWWGSNEKETRLGAADRGDGPLASSPELRAPPSSRPTLQGPALPAASPPFSVAGGRRWSPAASARLPLCSCLPVVHADYYECHHLVRHVDIIIFS